MGKRNWIIDLRSTTPPIEAGDAQLAQALLRFDTREDLALSLPNVSLCADFLLSPSRRGIVGVAVAISDEDKDRVERLFTHCVESRVRWNFSGSSVPERFEMYRDWNWLEVVWTDLDDLDLVEAQSNAAIWHSSVARPFADACVLVLEDIDYIAKECSGAPLIRQ